MNGSQATILQRVLRGEASRTLLSIHNDDLRLRHIAQQLRPRRLPDAYSPENFVIRSFGSYRMNRKYGKNRRTDRQEKFLMSARNSGQKKKMFANGEPIRLGFPIPQVRKSSG